jgi:hypothetical protein
MTGISVSGSLQKKLDSLFFAKGFVPVRPSPGTAPEPPAGALSVRLYDSNGVSLTLLTESTLFTTSVLAGFGFGLLPDGVVLCCFDSAGFGFGLLRTGFPGFLSVLTGSVG